MQWLWTNPKLLKGLSTFWPSAPTLSLPAYPSHLSNRSRGSSASAGRQSATPSSPLSENAMAMDQPQTLEGLGWSEQSIQIAREIDLRDDPLAVELYNRKLPKTIYDTYQQWKIISSGLERYRAKKNDHTWPASLKIDEETIVNLISNKTTYYGYWNKAFLKIDGNNPQHKRLFDWLNTDLGSKLVGSEDEVFDGVQGKRRTRVEAWIQMVSDEVGEGENAEGSMKKKSKERKKEEKEKKKEKGKGKGKGKEKEKGKGKEKKKEKKRKNA
ncbi:hypothetical protein CVT24_000894, partial [Panaeolus cyanescens]